MRAAISKVAALKDYVVGHRGAVLFMLFAVSFATFMAAGQAQQVKTTLCNLVATVQDVIFFVALALMILGGSLYAAAHILPAQQRGALQGYGMGMIIGGVVGVILVLVAPYILGQLLPATASTAGIDLSTCSIFGGGGGGGGGSPSLSCPAGSTLSSKGDVCCKNSAPKAQFSQCMST